MKALKTKSIMSLIYAVLLALPLCAILSRVIYVQSNKNANQSYSGNQVVGLEETTELYANTEYYFTNVEDNLTEQTTIDIDTISQIDTEYDADETVDNGIYIECVFEQIGTLPHYQTNLYVNDLVYYDFVGSFTFTTSTDYSDVSNLCFYKKTITTGYLDNVFEYSISQFVDENDFGQLNLFEWFEDLFLSNTFHNALYVHFANWYLNYAMLISLMQILFLVLMWFVNFSRKLLDRGMNYDW